jgi:uncharacterized protein (DUF433 family)
MATSPAERITKTPGVCGGRTCIAGHRVRVLDMVVWHEQQGLTPDEIVSQIPSITLADVHAALAYYYDHREEIQDEIRLEREQAEEFRRNNASLLDSKLSGGSEKFPERGRSLSFGTSTLHRVWPPDFGAGALT